MITNAAPLIHQVDVAGAQGSGDQTRVERHARAEHRPACDGRDDEDLGVRVSLEQTGEMGGDVAEAVAHVVADAGRGRRLQVAGKRHEHGVGERNEELVGERPAPVSAAQAEAVHRQGRNGGAVARAAAAARRTSSAVDLERNDHQLSRSDVGDPFADFQNLGHALVTETNGERERRRPEGKGPVQVARGDRHGMHDRSKPAGRRRHGDVAPRQTEARAHGERSHERSGRPDPLPHPVTRRHGNPAEPLAGITLQRCGRERRRNLRREQPGGVPQPSAGTMLRPRGRSVGPAVVRHVEDGRTFGSDPALEGPGL